MQESMIMIWEELLSISPESGSEFGVVQYFLTTLVMF